jgi:hypothetical protein
VIRDRARRLAGFVDADLGLLLEWLLGRQHRGPKARGVNALFQPPMALIEGFAGSDLEGNGRAEH